MWDFIMAHPGNVVNAQSIADIKVQADRVITTTSITEEERHSNINRNKGFNLRTLRNYNDWQYFTTIQRNTRVKVHKVIKG